MKLITLFCSEGLQSALTRIRMTPAWPYLAPVCRGVSPYWKKKSMYQFDDLFWVNAHKFFFRYLEKLITLFFMSGLQPANSNTRQVSLWPFWQQRCNGANPPRFFIYALAFHLHRIWTVWLNPFQAASCSAVLPCWNHTKNIMWNWIRIPVFHKYYHYSILINNAITKQLVESQFHDIFCFLHLFNLLLHWFFFCKYLKSNYIIEFFLLLFKVKISVIFGWKLNFL